MKRFVAVPVIVGANVVSHRQVRQEIESARDVSMLTNNRPIVLVSPDAQRLEKFAAQELVAYLQRLFGFDAAIVSSSFPVDAAATCLVLGRDRDAHVRRAVGLAPVLSSQGYLIRRTSPHTLVLAGGSGAATAWAVYEFIEQYGVRFLLHGDVFPRHTGPFTLPHVDLVREPVQTLRSWRVFSDLPTGPVLWSLAQHKQFMNQLFKLRFNAVNCCLWPHHPVIDYKVRGISRRTAEVLFGQIIPVDDDNIGREHFGCEEILTNPELRHAVTYTEKVTAGKQLVHGIFDHARSLQMHTTLSIYPFEFPKEFKPLLQKPTQDSIQIGDLCCAERGDLDNDGHVELAATVFQAFLDEYAAKIDELYLGLPEHPQAGERYQPAWRKLAVKYNLEPQFSAGALVKQARANHLTAGGAKRAVNEIKSTIAMLEFLDHFFDRTGLLKQAQQQKVRVGLTLGCGSVEIMPLLDRILWPDALVTTNLGYTSSRAVRRLADMGRLKVANLPAALILTLQDDNIGSIPHVATENMHILLQEMHALGWRGYFTRFWPIGDLDPMAAYLSRASWDATVTPANAYVDHFNHAIGPRSTPDCCRVMRMLEDMTVILDLDFLSLLFPVLETMKRFVTPRPMEVGLFHVRALMEQSRTLLRRIEPHDEGPTDRAERLGYWISRLTFGIELLNEAEYLHEMSRRLRTASEGDPFRLEEARKFLARAIAAGEAAVRATAEHVRDDSDRATLAAYYHFAVREVRQFGQQMIDDIAERRHGGESRPPTAIALPRR